MDNKKSYVYKITCKITGEYYFGSSFNAKSDYYWGGGKRIRAQIAQYGKENFVKEILGEFNDRTIAHQVENEYIDKFRHDDKCLNIHLDYHFGTYSKESRAKLSTANRGEKNPWYGKHLSDETRAKLSAALRGEKNPMYGKRISEETRAKMSAAKLGEKNPMYGKRISEETRAKMSASHRGKLCGKHWRKNPVTGKREYYD